MSVLTAKKLKFCEGIASGMQQREAAIFAGYSADSAHVRGSMLMKEDVVYAKIAELKMATVADGDIVNSAPTVPQFNTPKAFLKHMMNMQSLPLGARMEAAKILMPYCHGKPAELGKKDAQKKRAADVGKKFATQSPPPLHVVK